MNLKNTVAAKLLCSAWSTARLDKALEEADLRMSKALDYVMPNNIKLSCIQIALHAEMSAKECMNLIFSNVRTAVADGTQLIVFPEYIGLLPLLSSDTLFDTAYQFSEDLIKYQSEGIHEAVSFFEKNLAQPLFDSYFHFFSALAYQTSVYILAGTTIVKTRDGLVNRAFLFDPDGNVVLRQDKLHLSSFEKACGLIPGNSIAVAQTKLCRIAALIGKDQRVYEAGHYAYQRGAQLLVCPSAFSTSLSSSYFQSCAFMRCQEHPLFAVSSWLTGEFMDLPFRSISGIYAPFSVSKQGDGIVIQTERPTANSCLTARIDMERLVDDPDLYTSDINPIVEELLQQEYAHCRRPSNNVVPLTQDNDDEDENEDEETDDENNEEMPDNVSRPDFSASKERR